jgi:hypothetical protein
MDLLSHTQLVPPQTLGQVQCSLILLLLDINELSPPFLSHLSTGLSAHLSFVCKSLTVLDNAVCHSLAFPLFALSFPAFVGFLVVKELFLPIIFVFSFLSTLFAVTTFFSHVISVVVLGSDSHSDFINSLKFTSHVSKNSLFGDIGLLYIQILSFLYEVATNFQLSSTLKTISGSNITSQFCI